MRRFTLVSPAVWTSARFRGLPTIEARLLYLYLLSNRHQNSAGCCVLPAGYACVDLEWTLEQYVSALEALATADMVDLDQDTDEVLVKRWFAKSTPQNASHYVGTLKTVDAIASPALREQARADLEAAWAKLLADKQAAEAAKSGKRPGAPPPPTPRADSDPKQLGNVSDQLLAKVRSAGGWNGQ